DIVVRGGLQSHTQWIARGGWPALSSISLSNNNEGVALIGQSATVPPEVVLLPTVGDVLSTPRRLTDSNPWLKNMKFAKQEVVKYKARDRLELEGILIRPLNEEKRKRYLLVLTLHGGPEAHDSNGWLPLYHSLGEVAAARGIAVL